MAVRSKAPARGRPRRPLVIDVHAHVRIEAVIDLVRKYIAESKHDLRSWNDAAVLARMAKDAKNPNSKHTNPHVRIADMDKMGVDLQVVSMGMPGTCYWTNGRTARQMTRACNDGMAAFVATYPDRFAGIGAVLLQEVGPAIKELEYAVGTLGLKGVTALTNVRGEDLGEKKYWPFWQRAAELGAPIFLHPLGFTQPDRMQKFLLFNTIGQPLEEALAMSSLIHEGVMERFPKLKIHMAHGGGYLPYYSGRSDSAYERDAETRKNIKHNISYYMRRFWYDTVIFDRRMAEYLIEKVGANRVMMGSDYPWRQWDAVGMISRSRRLSKAAKEQVLWKTAARLFRLSV